MWTEADMALWQGRVEAGGSQNLRWHQVVKPLPAAGSLHGSSVLLGFACDAGVRRNRGRAGASDGPDAIRGALAQLAYHGQGTVLDDGNVICRADELEAAQAELAARVSGILQRKGQPILLGGGHEIAWGSYQGLRDFLDQDDGRVGIINFDAHFDLRDPASGGTSGTPFRQIAEYRERRQQDFHYLVLGINPSANSRALFDYARAQGVRWFEDLQCQAANLATLQQAIDDFLQPLQYLYLTICLDAFPAAVAPGVSAPGFPGICPLTALSLLRHIRTRCKTGKPKLLLADIAEMNPRYDRDELTARWAARLVQETQSPATV